MKSNRINIWNVNYEAWVGTRLAKESARLYIGTDSTASFAYR